MPPLLNGVAFLCGGYMKIKEFKDKFMEHYGLVFVHFIAIIISTIITIVIMYVVSRMGWI